MNEKEKFAKAISDLIPTDLKATLLETAKKFKFNTAPVITPQNTPVAQAPAAMADAKLKDGTQIKADTPTIGVGSAITVVSPDGELPAPDGDMELDTGSIITVQGGKVTDMKPAPVDVVTNPAANPANPAAPQMPALMAEMKTEFETKLAEANKIISELQTKFEAQVKESEDLKKDFSAFAAAFSALLELPTAEPINTPEGKFAKSADKKFNKLTQFSKNK